jgi:hypothetical protein
MLHRNINPKVTISPKALIAAAANVTGHSSGLDEI